MLGYRGGKIVSFVAVPVPVYEYYDDSETEEMSICDVNEGTEPMDHQEIKNQKEWRPMTMVQEVQVQQKMENKGQIPAEAEPKPKCTQLLNGLDNLAQFSKNSSYSKYETPMNRNKLHAEREKSIYFNEFFKNHMKKCQDEAKRAQENFIKIDKECSFPLFHKK